MAGAFTRWRWAKATCTSGPFPQPHPEGVGKHLSVVELNEVQKYYGEGLPQIVNLMMNFKKTGEPWGRKSCLGDFFLYINQTLKSATQYFSLPILTTVKTHSSDTSGLTTRISINTATGLPESWATFSQMKIKR